MNRLLFALFPLCLTAYDRPSGSDQSTTKEQIPREIHTPTYDLLLPAEQKALPLLRRSGFAKAQ